MSVDMASVMLKRMSGAMLVETSSKTGQNIELVCILLLSFFRRQQIICTRNLPPTLISESWYSRRKKMEAHNLPLKVRKLRSY